MKQKQKNKWLKAISVALSCAMLATATPVGAFAEEIQIAESKKTVIADESSCGDNIPYTLDGNGLLTISGESEISEDVISDETVIPYEETNSDNTVAHAKDGFVIENGVLIEYTGTETEIIIPDGVTEIGDSVFEGNTSIKKVVIPEGVTYIGHYSFYGCTELEEIVFPTTLIDIGENTFWETKWLENESSENPLVIVNNLLVDGRKATGDVVIPNGVTKIEDKAFAANETITSIVIPGTVKIVSYYSFSGSGLVKVELQEGVEYIEESAFIDCTGLEKINFPESIIGIDICAFRAARKLKEAVIPNGVTYLGAGAFNSCSDLQKLVIPSSVTEIGEALLGWDENISTILYVEKGSYAETYAIENNLTYQIYEREDDAVSTYIYDASEESVVTTDMFHVLLKENETKDVIIQSGNGITFTFAKGTMLAVEGMENYNFGTNVISDFASAGKMDTFITKDNFITRINYNYSGQLPATASIKIFVGAELKGNTLHYSKILEDGFKYIQSVAVDADGYIMVKQDYCSDYVVTTEKLGTTDNTGTTDNVGQPNDTTQSDDTNKSDDKTAPQTGDNSNLITYATMLVFGASLVVIAMQKKKVNN